MKNLIKFLLSPKGRIRRMAFVNAWVLVISLMIACYLIVPAGVNYLIFMPLFLFIPTVKRLHDIHLNGFYALIVYQLYGLLAFQANGMNAIEMFGYVVPMSTLIYYMLWPTFVILFYLAVKKGDIGTNRYGINPAWKVVPRVPLAEFLSWRGIALKIGEKHK
tara:strand:- start:101187 stop:101672 length:486 start_codon:yes stop_codon:yes gene_type:complete